MALDFRVRIAWATDPFDPSPTWTDVSSFVDVGSHSVDITRGSGDLDDSVNPSTLSLTFNNKDGRFTPGYASGAYYPNVVLGKRIQVHSFDGTTYYPRFDGFIDTLPMQWAPTGRYAEAAVTAVDRLKKLGRQLSFDNLISTYYRADSPGDYWQMADAEGTTVPKNETGTTALQVTLSNVVGAAFEFGSATGPGTDGQSAASTHLASLQATDTAFVYPGQYTIECFVRWQAPVPSGSSPETLVSLGGGTSSFALLMVNNPGDPSVGLVTYRSSVVSALAGTSNVMDGNTHHVAATYDSTAAGGTAKVYVDGALQATATGAGVDATALGVSVVAQDIWTTPYVVAHVAVFPSVLSAARIALHANAGLNGFAGDTSLTRFARIAGLAGITPVTTGTAGSTNMGGLPVQGQSYLELLQAVQNTENGAMFVQTDGDLQLVPRTAFYNETAGITLTAGQYSTDLTFLADDSRLVNDVSVTDANGVTTRLQNATSITANGTYSIQKDLNTLITDEAVNWADWQVNVASSTSARASQVTLDLLTVAAQRVTAWGLEIGNRLDLTGLPTGAPSSSVQLQIAGYTESYSLTNYTITFNTVPYLTGNIWTLDDAVFGVLDAGHILGY